MLWGVWPNYFVLLCRFGLLVHDVVLFFVCFMVDTEGRAHAKAHYKVPRRQSTASPHGSSKDKVGGHPTASELLRRPRGPISRRSLRWLGMVATTSPRSSSNSQETVSMRRALHSPSPVSEIRPTMSEAKKAKESSKWIPKCPLPVAIDALAVLWVKDASCSNPPIPEQLLLWGAALSWVTGLTPLPRRSSSCFQGINKVWGGVAGVIVLII